jgi:hypothetical protein
MKLRASAFLPSLWGSGALIPIPEIQCPGVSIPLKIPPYGRVSPECGAPHSGEVNMALLCITLECYGLSNDRPAPHRLG